MPKKQKSPPNWISMAKLGAPFGIKGWIKVQSFTSPVTNILTYSPWWIEQDGVWQPFPMEGPIEHGQHILARPLGCVDCEQARYYTHKVIAIEHAQLPPLNQDEYYWIDLVGLQVVTADQHILGIVDHLFATGANDVLVVKGKTKHLIPFIYKDVIKSVDLNQGMLVVNWSDDYA